jgi:hypothetical protein
MNSEIVFEAKKQRVIRAIEKYGRLSNRELSRKCSVYGDNFTRALREIDNPEQVVKQPITAKQLADIREKYLVDSIMPVVDIALETARKAAMIGKSSIIVYLCERTDTEKETIIRFFHKLGFSASLRMGKLDEVHLGW